MRSDFGLVLKTVLIELEEEAVCLLKHRHDLWISIDILNQFGHFEGCSEDEINQLKLEQKVAYLPDVYVSVLLSMGRHSGNLLFAGTYGTFPRIKTLKIELIDFLSYNYPNIILPSNAFVFCTDYAGTESLFFLVHPEDNDPTIFVYHEGHYELKVLNLSLSDWYKDQINLIKDRLKK